MTIKQLIECYRWIGIRLLSFPEHDDLGRDYLYVAGLLATSGDRAQLIGELRRNLNRSKTYTGHQKRNATLQVLATTIERVEKREQTEDTHEINWGEAATRQAAHLNGAWYEQQVKELALRLGRPVDQVDATIHAAQQAATFLRPHYEIAHFLLTFLQQLPSSHGEIAEKEESLREKND